MSKLTNRELQVIALVAEGKLNKQIGAQLNIADKTVKVHRSRAMEKLEVRSVPDLVKTRQSVQGFETRH